MPITQIFIRPSSASDPVATSDEASLLEYHLQQQLQEDIARIFDESIYSDVEVVCGKFKILTHSCILKARTNNFYRKLETILHDNIGRSSYDEIYSFISDAYTECNINVQETQIISYLDKNLNLKEGVIRTWNNKDETDENDVFLTPKCISPYAETQHYKSISSSPSTELTKEYYALVPIEGSLLDKELIEQDELSNAFNTIIKTQSKDLREADAYQSKKPNSLSIRSSYTYKFLTHSSSCDILLKKNPEIKEDSSHDTNSTNNTLTKSDVSDKISNKNANIEFRDSNAFDSTCSPDSLITELSSSSDYISVENSCSPGVSTSVGLPLNVGNNKMENIFQLSDSGIETTLESINNHKDVTLNDVSMTESTLYDLIDEPTTNSQNCTNISTFEYSRDNTSFNIAAHAFPSCGTSSRPIEGKKSSNDKTIDIMNITSKEDKQRHNEEIVMLESSSVSSETGSWESVFPPKTIEKEHSRNLLHNECKSFNQHENYKKINKGEDLGKKCGSLVPQKVTSTACFIDASSLGDDDNAAIATNYKAHENLQIVVPPHSKPVPCSSLKVDVSPNEISDNNDDSLEQNTEYKDQDSVQRDLSPTIFEMTPLTEDSLCTNEFENAIVFKEITQLSEANTSNFQGKYEEYDKSASLLSCSAFETTTPNNSIMSLPGASIKQLTSEENQKSRSIEIEASPGNLRISKKFNESSPIISGGASIEDHLPYKCSSPTIRRKVDNIPIVSGAFSPKLEEKVRNKSLINQSHASAWIVDMAKETKSDTVKSSPPSSIHSKKAEYRNVGYLKDSHNSSGNKSRSSVDSDGSERTSHKFFIDFSSLPDPFSPIKVPSDNAVEKKNIFSMYIDLGEKSAVKEMPSKLSESMNSKKIFHSGNKQEVTNTNVELIRIPENDDIATDFSVYESLCNDPNISITEIIQKTSSSCNANIKSDFTPAVSSYQEVVKKDNAVADLFVRLSDLDKPVVKPEISLSSRDEKVIDMRMTKSIPENNWRERSISDNSNMTLKVINSFHSENALSLNRLFPHLKNEFSKSMPGSLSNRTRSPLRGGMYSSSEEQNEISDVSEVSSIQSSVCRSIVASNTETSTTEETSQSSSLLGNCQSRLGQDLLRMFLEEIAPDVIVEVSGRRIKAHKCILSSRCQYFAGIMSGGWVQSTGNVILLPPFSFNVVHFALCHIYSGISTIPDSISIVELATLADMLALEGLKEAIMFNLKAKYCHHFHRPCQVCTVGVLECFPLSSLYALDDLYRKCLKWITKYFYKVWPTKAFATLPKELLDKCYQQHIVNLSLDNFFDTVCGCGIAVSNLQTSRWAESINRMCRRLLDATSQFAAPRLLEVIQLLSTSHSDVPEEASDTLEECIHMAIEWAPPEETCRVYAFLSDLINDIYSYKKHELLKISAHKTSVKCFVYDRADDWRSLCENELVRASPFVAGTQAFKDLPLCLKKILRERGCIMYDGQQNISSASVSDKRTMNKKSRASSSSTTRSLDIDHVRTSFVPYSQKPVTPVLKDVFKIKSNCKITANASTPKVRTTKAQEERAKYNKLKSHQSQERLNRKSLTSAGSSLANVKSRLMKPMTNKEKENKPKLKRPIPNIVSSSESSRNSSSSSRVRNVRDRGGNRQQMCDKTALSISQDSLTSFCRTRTAEPSTESLTETATNISINGKQRKSLNPRTVNPSSELLIKSPAYLTVTVKQHKLLNPRCEDPSLKSQTESPVSTTCTVKQRKLLNPPTADPSLESLTGGLPANRNFTVEQCKSVNRSAAEPSIKSLADSSPTTNRTINVKRHCVEQRCTWSVPKPVHCQAYATITLKRSSTEQSEIKGKHQTKIPVYLNQTKQRQIENSQKRLDNKAFRVSNAIVNSKVKNERQPPASLMQATKSSSAKIVPRAAKDEQVNKNPVKHPKEHGKQCKQADLHNHPVMERSGTFLKDEPTFGDKTTSID